MFSLFQSSKDPQAAARSAYEFSFKTLGAGEPLPLKQFAGQAILVVNTASKCGLTPQYKALEELYLTHRDQGLVVLGVPSNDFLGQEPGSDADIAAFCERRFGVTFPLASKERVVGDDAHPFYVWARQVFGFLGVPRWNFHKYLINRQGHLVDFFVPTTGPDSARVKEAIEKALAEAP